MNPLTSLRKLGVSLVGNDGLLNSAAAIHLGYGPMAQVKQALEARDKAQADNATDLKYKTDQFDLEKDIAKTKQEAELFPIKKQQEQFNLDKGKAEEQRQATEFSHTEDDRLKKQREEEAFNQELARSFRLPPDQARAKYDAMAAMERAGIMLTESMSPEVKKYLGISDSDIFAFKSNIEIAKGIAQEKANTAREERMNAREDRITQGLLDRQAQNDQKSLDRDYENTKKFVKSLQTINLNARQVDAEWNRFLDAADQDPNKQIVVEQTLINTINKMFDPNSVVREGEYDRTSKAASDLDQFWQGIRRITKGGIIPLGVLKSIHTSFQNLARISRETYEDEVERFQRRHNLTDQELTSKYFSTSRVSKKNQSSALQRAFAGGNNTPSSSIVSPTPSPTVSPTPNDKKKAALARAWGNL